MPLVTVTLHKGPTREFKAAILDAIQRSLVASGVPEADRFHRVLELDEADFRYDSGYPDVGTKRGAEFVLIEILWSVGRSVKIKRKVVVDIAAALARDPGSIRNR